MTTASPRPHSSVLSRRMFDYSSLSSILHSLSLSLSLFSFAAVQCSGYTECGSSGKVLISAAATTNCTAASCTEAECCTTGHFEHKQKCSSSLAISPLRMRFFVRLVLRAFLVAARQQRRPRHKSAPANIDFSRSICFPSTPLLMRQN